jgi:hypothetical protein
MTNSTREEVEVSDEELARVSEGQARGRRKHDQSVIAVPERLAAKRVSNS